MKEFRSQTHSGQFFLPGDPQESAIEIEDIAHALSHICRFTGHIKKFYSVAEHSYWVSCLVPPEYQLAALLHDAAEAYIGDIPSGEKNMLQPKIGEIEHNILSVIYKKFGVNYTPIPEPVKYADFVMLLTEKEQLFEHNLFWYPEQDTHAHNDVKVVCLEPERACRLFMSRFIPRLKC